MKIKMFAAMHGRQPIVRLFHAGYKRLKKDFDIDLHLVVSDADDASFCKALGIDYSMCHNAPISNKHNYGVRSVLNHDWDALLIMGSDDVLTTQGLHNLVSQKQSHAGFDAVVYVDSYTLDAKVYSYAQTGLRGHVIGAGRLLSRDLVLDVWDRKEIRCTDEYGPYSKRSKFMASTRMSEYLVGSKKFQYDKKAEQGLWPEFINRGLDHAMEQMLVVNGYVPVALSGMHVFDFKTMHNIWQYEDRGGGATSFENLRHLFSDEENEIINSIAHNVKKG